MTRIWPALAVSLLLTFTGPVAAFDGIRITLLGRSVPDGSGGPSTLVEASNETINFTPEYVASRVQRTAFIDMGLKVGKPGVPVMPMPPGASSEAIMGMLPETLRTTKDELGAFERTPEDMRKPGGFGRLGDTPLVVIRRGKPMPGSDEGTWRRSQEELLKLSSNSRMVVAEQSGHMVPIDEPEVVAGVIRDMIK